MIRIRFSFLYMDNDLIVILNVPRQGGTIEFTSQRTTESQASFSVIDDRLCPHMIMAKHQVY